jgi:histo-blood group ABO system transferase
MLTERLAVSLAQYTFYLDADMLFVRPVDGEIFSELVATIHPGFIDLTPEQFPYERRTDSAACIPVGMGHRYYQASFLGGSTDQMIAAFADLDRATQQDEDCGIVAYAHDESHWNRYLTEHPPTLELGPDYSCTLEDRDRRWWQTRRITHVQKDTESLRT